MLIKPHLRDFVSLFFPPACAGCGAVLGKGEQVICVACAYHLPYTHFHKDPANRGARQLWGRVPLEGVTAYLYFYEPSRVQNIVHQLKYRNRPDIGVAMGRKYGEVLCDTAPYSKADCIIPVPLHPRKLRRRGYNQSTSFGQGLSIAMQKPLIEKGLRQCRPTKSQTKKGRYQRFENSRKVFEVTDPDLLSGRHILLVDDVLTTGATVEACAAALLADPTVRVSVVTLAHAL